MPPDEAFLQPFLPARATALLYLSHALLLNSSSTCNHQSARENTVMLPTPWLKPKRCSQGQRSRRGASLTFRNPSGRFRRHKPFPFEASASAQVEKSVARVPKVWRLSIDYRVARVNMPGCSLQNLCTIGILGRDCAEPPPIRALAVHAHSFRAWPRSDGSI